MFRISLCALLALALFVGCGDDSTSTVVDVAVTMVNEDQEAKTTATNLSSTEEIRYISVFPANRGDTLAFAEIEAWDAQGNNVALNGIAYFVSADDDNNYGENINDGAHDSGVLLDNSLPWVHLDLGRDHLVTAITIHPYCADGSCGSYSSDDLIVAIASEDYRSPRHTYRLVSSSETTPALSRKSNAICDGGGDQDYIDTVIFDAEDDFTCDMDLVEDFDGFGSGETIYYECTYDETDESDDYYTSSIDQDIPDDLTCTVSVLDACMELIDNGTDPCSLWCANFTFSDYEISINSIECKSI